MGIDFEWDPEKAAKNLFKHGISFNEAARVFLDRYSLTTSDPRHSGEEQRFLELGMSEEGQILVVSFTLRGEVVRIISCRLARPSERKRYEENRSQG